MLNINTYEIKAKYIPTGRLRTIKVEARAEADAIAKLSSDYTDVKSVAMKNRPPTERQLSYAESLGITVTDDMCFEDVSCLISGKTDDRNPPKQGLIDFADSHNIAFSNYIGKRALYNKVFYGLPQRDAIAFFVFSVYRHLSDDRESNLDKSFYKDSFYEFADAYENDNKFVKSLYDNYQGEDLRFFGTLHTINGYDESWHSGGNARTYAFKCAKQFLYDKYLITEMETKVSKTLRPQKEKKPNEETYTDITVTPAPVKATGSGCMLPVFAIMISICILILLL